MIDITWKLIRNGKISIYPSTQLFSSFFGLLAITDGMKSANNTVLYITTCGLGTCLQLIFFKTGKGFLSFTICDMLFCQLPRVWAGCWPLWQNDILTEDNYWLLRSLISHPLSLVTGHRELPDVPRVTVVIVSIVMTQGPLLIAIFMVMARAPGLEAADEESECNR